MRFAWREAAGLWTEVLRRAWGWLLATALISSSLDFVIEYIRKVDEMRAVFVGLAAILVSLLLGVLTTIAVSQTVFDAKNKTATSLLTALKLNIKPVFIETTRAIVPVLIGFICLIIPGVIEIVRLWFVAYIAQFDKEYKAGKVDALERSRQLAKGHFWPLFSSLILVFILGMLPTLWRESMPPSEHLVHYVLLLLIGIGLQAYLETVLYLYYEYLVLELRNKNGHSISLPGTA